MSRITRKKLIETLEELDKKNTELLNDIKAIIYGEKQVIHKWVKHFKDSSKLCSELQKAFLAGNDYTPPGADKQVGRVESLKPFPPITAGQAQKFWGNLPNGKLKIKDKNEKTKKSDRVEYLPVGKTTIKANGKTRTATSNKKRKN